MDNPPFRRTPGMAPRTKIQKQSLKRLRTLIKAGREQGGQAASAASYQSRLLKLFLRGRRFTGQVPRRLQTRYGHLKLWLYGAMGWRPGKRWILDALEATHRSGFSL